jgi:biofilm PGA synthesis N-glycosyltransferase PgaC
MSQQLAREGARLGGMARRPRPGGGGRPTVRFAIALSLTAAYVAFSIYVSTPWRSDLRAALGPVMAWVIPISLAYVPGVLIGFLAATLLTVRYRVPSPEPPKGSWQEGQWPPVTVVIAAWNEERTIVPTLERIAALAYAGPVQVVLADNNSTDRTAERAHQAAQRLGLEYRRIVEPTAGKHHALNTALESVTTPLVSTVDADTFLHPEALTYLVARVTSRPQDQHVCACAGALVVENATGNLLTRMQGWDYRLGINGVKRMQAAYNSALVAQGAFSVYWTEDLRAVGGWPDAIGEDIVLTWTLMDSRGLVQYEPCALSFTAVPERVTPFMRQRSRWARGMFEGLHRNPPRHQPRVLAKFVAGIDYLIPVLDFGYIFFWIPGVILFIAGYPLIFSWWSMLVIPITLIIYGLLRRWQERHVFRRLDVHPQQDMRGFYGYLFGYQALTSSAALRGYLQYLTGAARRWK